MSKAQTTLAGLTPSQADAVGGRVAYTLTAAGTNQATAAICLNDTNVFTTVGLGTAAILGAEKVAGQMNILNIGDEIFICNYGANALLVFPPVGGKILNGALNASVSLAVNTCARFKNLDGLNFSQG